MSPNSWKWLLLGVEDAGHVKREHHLTNLFLLYSSFFCPFVLFSFMSPVSSTPSKNLVRVRALLRAGFQMARKRFLCFLLIFWINCTFLRHIVASYRPLWPFFGERNSEVAKYIEDITRWREDMNFMLEWQERGMGNGEWRMGNGKWEMENDKWKIGNGEWGIGNSIFFTLTCYKVV